MADRDEKARDGEVRDEVREGYARIARSDDSCCGGSPCGGADMDADSVARRLGYDEEELLALPAGANMALACGNPTALASLQEGEVVVDLGSGGGLDVFIAARRVGPGGRAIGVDMTAEMVSKARRNAEQFRESTGLDNVEFRLGEIEHLPLADASVDVVISNCVINLSPDKPQVWREVARVLKPGGRVAVSDLALLRPLPEEVRRSVEGLIACVAGAVSVEDSLRMAREAGLADVAAGTEPIYSDDPSEWADQTFADIAEMLPEGMKPSDYVASMNLTAVKPESPAS